MDWRSDTANSTPGNSATAAVATHVAAAATRLARKCGYLAVVGSTSAAGSATGASIAAGTLRATALRGALALTGEDLRPRGGAFLAGCTALLAFTAGLRRRLFRSRRSWGATAAVAAFEARCAIDLAASPADLAPFAAFFKALFAAFSAFFAAFHCARAVTAAALAARTAVINCGDAGRALARRFDFDRRFAFFMTAAPIAENRTASISHDGVKRTRASFPNRRRS